MQLARVSTFTLQKFRPYILDKGLAVATANRAAATWNHMGGAFQRCVETAELDPARATPHAMRHTAVTRFSAAASGNAAMVRKFSGHLSVQMILRYTHPADEHIDAALDNMSGDNLVDLTKARNAEKS